MKWSNKGHQLDEEGKRWVEAFRQADGIWVFGAGILGKETRALLEKYRCFQGYIDNDICKKEEISDCKVYSFQEYLDRVKKGWIVVAVKDIYAEEIQKQLENAGMEEGKDFFLHIKFFGRIFPVISMYGFGKLYGWKSEIGVTERCTLKCRKCVRGCGMIDMNHEDISMETVKASADFYFKNFDYVTEFCLIGGRHCSIDSCRRQLSI